MPPCPPRYAGGHNGALARAAFGECQLGRRRRGPHTGTNPHRNHVLLPLHRWASGHALVGMLSGLERLGSTGSSGSTGSTPLPLLSKALRTRCADACSLLPRPTFRRYHAHTGVQFGSGLRGALVVTDPDDPAKVQCACCWVGRRGRCPHQRMQWRLASLSAAALPSTARLASTHNPHTILPHLLTAQALYDEDSHLLLLADVFNTTTEQQLEELRAGGHFMAMCPGVDVSDVPWGGVEVS